VSRRSNAILALLLSAGIASLGLYVGSRLEQVEEEVPVGLQGAARENSLLAAERFLDRMGLPAAGFESLGTMPPQHDALVLTETTRSLSKREVSSLATWVAGGGHIIVSPARDGYDPLFSVLGVEVIRRAPGEGEKPAVASSLVSIPFSGPEESLQARMGEDIRLRVLRRPGDPAPERSEPAAIVGFPMMSGTISAVSDMDFIKNDAIGDLDHARLFWRLVRQGGTPNGVWLVRGGESVSLAALLWRRSRRLLIALTALIVAWLWTSTVRFGPLLAVPAPGSRSLLEHVEAVGFFLWRRGGHSVLIESARAELRREISRRRPYLDRLSHAERSTALAAESSLPRRDILSALAAPCPRDPERFTRTMRTLEALRKAL